MNSNEANLKIVKNITWETVKFIINLLFTVSAKNSDPHTFCNKKMDQNSQIYFSRIIKFYLHVEDGITSLPANIGVIRWKK